MILRSAFLIGAATWLASILMALPLAAKPRPNVLFIVSDDLNCSIGCYGHPIAKTPNIDRLAERGIRFDRAYCQFPLCGPSWNSMLTGLYPNSTGILTNGQIFRQSIPQHRSLPQAFRLAGYFVGRIGKMYHYDVPRSIGTNGNDDPASWEMELNPAGCDRLVEEPNVFAIRPGISLGSTISWFASPRPDKQHTDGMMASDAEWVLERCARQSDRPFFLAVGFFRPHTPFVAPKQYFEQYQTSQMPLVEVTEDEQKDVPAAAIATRKPEEWAMTEDQQRQAIQAYFASVTFMDAQVGRMLDALDRLRLTDNTIVVFASDHGFHLGEHGLWQKKSLFQESARVPLVIAAPGMTKSGGVVQAPVGLVDLYPTLAELCGVETPDGLQGQSLAPILANIELPGRGWALSQVSRSSNGRRTFGYSLSTPRWRYTEWDEGRQGRELYDHESDPREQTNLAEHSAQSSRVEKLSRELREAVAATMPESGKIPPVGRGNWLPNLTDP